MEPSGITLTLVVLPYNSDVHSMNWLEHIWRNRSWYNKIFYNPIEKKLVELSGVLEIRLFSKFINVTQFILLNLLPWLIMTIIFVITFLTKFQDNDACIGSYNAHRHRLILDGFHLPQRV